MLRNAAQLLLRQVQTSIPLYQNVATGRTATGTSSRLLSARWMSQCSCPGLGGPPPDKMHIEYDPEDLEKFIQFADALEEQFPGLIVEGNLEGDGRPLSFEVTLPDGDQVIFSKLQNGRLPTVDEVADMFSSQPS